MAETEENVVLKGTEKTHGGGEAKLSLNITNADILYVPKSLGKVALRHLKPTNLLSYTVMAALNPAGSAGRSITRVVHTHQRPGAREGRDTTCGGT